VKHTTGVHTRLLISLIVLLSVAPFVEDFPSRGLIIESLFVLMIVSALFDVGGGRKFLIVGAVVAAPAVVSSIVDMFVGGSRAVEFTSTATTLAFILFAISRLLRSVLSDRSVSSETIRGAICIYLFLGIAWSTGYSLVELAYPGSFNHPTVASAPAEASAAAEIGEEQSYDAARFFYFSFVTLTTLGYGDITPLSPPARFLALLESIAGQLFIAITIARLVAIQISQPPSESKHE